MLTGHLSSPITPAAPGATGAPAPAPAPASSSRPPSAKSAGPPHSRPQGLGGLMKGKIASRAHSFKENILEAFKSTSSASGSSSPGPDGGGGGGGASGHKAASGTKTSIQLAKKTNSTDNLIGYTEPKQSTDRLVGDVQRALGFFEDAVTKGTYELLPGCASIVLCAVSSIQSFVFYESELKNDAKLATSLQELYHAIARLTQWADEVIMSGSVDPSDEYRDLVIEPVRKFVIILVNQLNSDESGGIGGGGGVKKGSQLHNSLPDITSPELESIPRQPPKLPKRTHHNHQHHQHHQHRNYHQHNGQVGEDSNQASPPPPLPPKHNRPDPLTLDNFHNNHADWFSNPLFQKTAGEISIGDGMSSSNNSCSFSHSSLDQQLATTPHGLDTRSFPFMDEAPTSPLDLSRESAEDELDFHRGGLRSGGGPGLISWSSSVEPVSPPALPKKEQKRKISQYDNVWDSSSQQHQHQQPPPPPQPAIDSCQPHRPLSSIKSHPGRPHLERLTASQSFDYDPGLRPGGVKMRGAGRYPFPGGGGGGGVGTGAGAVIGAAGAQAVSPLALERRSSDGDGDPPPLPPKKRDIINYMEMLGQSLLPTREELMKSLAQTQLLLQNVWAENYHEFGEFIPDNSSFNFPVTEGLFTRNIDLSRLQPSGSPHLSESATSAGIPPSFPNMDDYSIHPPSHANPPPALPPKKNRPATSGNAAGKERIIPIVRESDGRVIMPNQYHQQPQHHQQQPQHHHHHHHHRHSSGHQYNNGTANSITSTSTSSSSKRLSSESAHSVASSSNNTNTSSSLQSADSLASMNATSSGNNKGEREIPIQRDGSFRKNPSQSSILSSSSTGGSAGAGAGAAAATAVPPAPPPPPSSTSGIASSLNSSLCSPSVVAPATPAGGGPAHSSAAQTPQLVVPEDSALNQAHFERWESLIYANNTDGILELRAGHIDELIILATQSTCRDFVYQDAFLLTYRTFISTLSLLWKLEYRFRRFNTAGDTVKLKAARNAFSLLVRVVDSLIDYDFQDSDVTRNLSEFIVEMVNNGDLQLAKALRTKFIQKFEENRTRLMPDFDFGRLTIHQKQLSILHFKAPELAEQITLMDEQYFRKLEPGELLLWVKENNEEKSPNLVKFTKHFNDMSYWCRTLILQESEAKERERLVMKVIKVMKFLRKHNNFNSYLAFLSALDSSALRRLDWSKSIVETIEEYSGIIDFSGSFRAYREALSKSSGPVIPYMGLVLQDLTFVHIGNSDLVKNKVNFAKRWQQFNILDNIRRFKRKQYQYKRREDIISIFGNFVKSLSENELWELSKMRKPGTMTPASPTTKCDSPAILSTAGASSSNADTSSADTMESKHQPNKTYHT